MPTQERLLELFIYKPNTGELLNAVHRPNLPVGWPVRFVLTEGYLKVYADHRYYFAHRIIWTLTHGPINFNQVIDHIDGNRTNNKISNLRAVYRRANSKNLKRYVTNSSGVTGVSWDKSIFKWSAYIKVSDKLMHLGRFEEFHAAVAARKEAELVHNFHPNHGRVVQLEAA